MDEILSLVPWAAPTISALAVLIQNIGNRRSISKRLDIVERTMHMLLLHDEHLPLGTRLDEGKKYIDMGGNGSSAAYYEKLKLKYQERVARHMEEKI